MSQTDFNVANASGAAVRADINAHLDALASLSAGASAPSTIFPNQLWYDTSSGQLKKRNNANTGWLATPQIDAPIDTNGNAINESEGSTVASASTTNIWVTNCNTIKVNGVVTINSFGTAPRIGAWRKVIFSGTPILKHSANLNLPGSADITAAIDDFAFVYADTATQFDVLYFKKDGRAVVASTIPQATQSAIEAETDENTYVPPDLLKHHPGIPKAWVKFDGTAAGPITPDGDYNVTDVTDGGTGKPEVNFTVAFSSADYGVSVTGQNGTGTNNNGTGCGIQRIASPLATGSAKLVTGGNDSTTLLDLSIVTAAFFGDQA